MTNFSSWNIDIEKGDRIARIIFLKKEEVNFVEINEFDDKTDRDMEGFGSTGLKLTNAKSSQILLFSKK